MSWPDCTCEYASSDSDDPFASWCVHAALVENADWPCPFPVSPGPLTRAVPASQLKRAESGSENERVALRFGCELPAFTENANASRVFGVHVALMPPSTEPPRPVVSANDSDGVSVSLSLDLIASLN